MTIENLHWSDATSEEWLTSLVARLTGAPLLVLVTYRPRVSASLAGAVLLRNPNRAVAPTD